MSELLKKLREYNQITDFAAIARRYFVNNFYDGILTVTGMLLGFFTFILRDPGVTIESSYVVITGLGVSISMLISGVSGSYLSERAELRKERIELEKAMGVHCRKTEETLKDDNSEDNIRKAMLLPKKKDRKKQVKVEESQNNNKIKTIHEKAETFTGIIVSVINGLSPFLGGIFPIIPFFFVDEAGLQVFLTAFALILIAIILLGAFLGKISKDSIIKNILQMMGFFFLTILIITVFLGL